MRRAWYRVAAHARCSCVSLRGQDWGRDDARMRSLRQGMNVFAARICARGGRGGLRRG
jgi:hypothetical protein